MGEVSFPFHRLGGGGTHDTLGMVFDNVEQLIVVQNICFLPSSWSFLKIL